jgi:hypothetical protein
MCFSAPLRTVVSPVFANQSLQSKSLGFG